MTREEIIRKYFDAWLSKDSTELPLLFASDVVYSECYGPEYRGIAQILRWFSEWNQRGTVLRWDIKKMIACQNTVCAEWYFCCEYDDVADGFDGVSWIEFDENDRIVALREFQSKAEHHFPYGEEKHII